MHTCPIRVTGELKFPWDPGISSIFSGAKSTLSAICAFSDLLLTAVDPSHRPDLSPPLWLELDARLTVLRSPPWPD